MYSKKTLTLLAVIAGLALVAAYWKDIQAWIASRSENKGSGSSTDKSADAASQVTGTPATPTQAAAGGAAGGAAASQAKIRALPGPPSPSNTLKRGVKHQSVYVLQLLLRALGNNIAADGDFGQNTETALYAVTKRKTITLRGFFAAGYVPKNSAAYTIAQQYHFA